jgi:putative aminopeptidase FrvX
MATSLCYKKQLMDTKTIDFPQTKTKEHKISNSIDLIIKKTAKYLATPSVVGYENFFLGTLKEYYESVGLNALMHDGLLEVHGTAPRSAILCAHVDRHGLISIGHGEYVYAAQYIKEIKYGQNNRASQREIETITRRFVGEHVYAYDPRSGEKMGSGVIRACEAWMRKGDALFEIEGAMGVDLGLPVAYARTARVENGKLLGQIDNAVSLGVIAALFANGFQGTVLFTTEEEIGKSWTHAIEWLSRHKIETKNLIILDTSPYNDPEPIDQGMIIFRNRDMSGVFNLDLARAFKSRATAMGLHFQFKDEVLLSRGKTIEQIGSTELGKIILNSAGRWSGASVQIPTLMYHTSNETTSLKALENYYRFLEDILIKNPIDTGE